MILTVVKNGFTTIRARFGFLPCLLLFASLFIANPCFAQHSSEPGIDIVLLMDSSGSMKKTDPDELRKPAAKLLISLLGPHDHASVVSFSDEGYPISYLSSASTEQAQSQLFSAVEKISSRGIYTNLYGAIETAKRVLEKGNGSSHQQSQQNLPEQRQIIVLMSDGKMDLGDDQRSKHYSDKLFSTLLPELKAAGIQLQTIAFTEQSDKELLANIALKTDGMFYVTKSDKELHQTFAAIFEQSARPDMLPFDEGRFQVDDSVSEVTIVGSKDNPDVTLSLTTPLNKTYSADDRPKQYKWRKSPRFDLITIPDPAPGVWHIKASNNNNKAYIVTNLALDGSITPDAPFAGDTIKIQAWLEREGNVLIKEAILSSLKLTAQIIAPGGTTHTFPFGELAAQTGQENINGIFTGYLQLSSSGRYAITLTADSGTFQRTQNYLIDVVDRPFEELPTVADNTVDTEEPLQQTPESEENPPVQVDVMPEEDEESNIVVIITVFIGANFLLLAIFVAIVVVRKRNKKQTKRG